MRPPVIAAAIIALLGGSLLVVSAGQRLKTEQHQTSIVPDEITDLPPMPDEQEPEAPVGTENGAAPTPDLSGQPAAEPPLTREAPRPPLSELSQALPPKTKRPADWDGATLHRPVAPQAGVIEAMGYTVRIAGIEPVDPDRVCSSGGQDWPCGAAARTAFRAFLRGRAVTCDIAQDAVPGTVEAACRLGKQDLARWLAANGWAEASGASAYAEAAEAARRAGKGMYGAPPEAAALPPPPPDALVTPPVDLPAPSE